MAPYPIFFRALKAIIMPNFMLLTKSEQFKHISALLFLEIFKASKFGMGFFGGIIFGPGIFFNILLEALGTFLGF